MKICKFAFFAIYIFLVQGWKNKEFSDPIKTQEQLEDMEVVKRTVRNYGMPINPHNFHLPGPEFLKRLTNVTENLFEGGPRNYILRVRTAIFPLCSFNGRYEIGTVKKLNHTEIPMVRGQFGEYFERKSGGFYVRTIGYTLNENGYKEFLLDLTKVQLPKVGMRLNPIVWETLLGGNIFDT